MATITNKNNFIEFELENQTHLISKANLEFLLIGHHVAILDNGNRQRNDKRFLLKYDEITNVDFSNGEHFYNWLAGLINKENNFEKDNRLIKEQTQELTTIREILSEQLKYLKKIYNPE